MCPPEGDAGTGMVATNSVAVRTGNVSAGTSIFAMVVLEKAMEKSTQKEIDMVTTPNGMPVAAVLQQLYLRSECLGEPLRRVYRELWCESRQE